MPIPISRATIYSRGKAAVLFLRFCAFSAKAQHPARSREAATAQDTRTRQSESLRDHAVLSCNLTQGPIVSSGHGSPDPDGVILGSCHESGHRPTPVLAPLHHGHRTLRARTGTRVSGPWCGRGHFHGRRRRAVLAPGIGVRTRRPGRASLFPPSQPGAGSGANGVRLGSGGIGVRSVSGAFSAGRGPFLSSVRAGRRAGRRGFRQGDTVSGPTSWTTGFSAPGSRCWTATGSFATGRRMRGDARGARVKWTATWLTSTRVWQARKTWTIWYGRPKPVTRTPHAGGPS